MESLEVRREQLLKKRPYLSSLLNGHGDSLQYKRVLGHSSKDNLNPKLVERSLSATPSRIGVGRTGNRYLTADALAMRADHAIAKDAVYSEVEQLLVEQWGALDLHSCCIDRHDYLLHPNKGRRLNDQSLERLQREGIPGVDVQMIIGDGLSAWAVEHNVPQMLPLLNAELKRLGFTQGNPIFVRFARVGVQDQIGVTLNARASVILIGERPGLGTGDSLSAYIAYGPKLDQDNSEKNCVSNIRQLGMLPADAVKEICGILQQAFASGRGGVESYEH